MEEVDGRLKITAFDCWYTIVCLAPTAWVASGSVAEGFQVTEEGRRTAQRYLEWMLPDNMPCSPVQTSGRPYGSPLGCFAEPLFQT